MEPDDDEIEADNEQTLAEEIERDTKWLRENAGVQGQGLASALEQLNQQQAILTDLQVQNRTLLEQLRTREAATPEAEMPQNSQDTKASHQPKSKTPKNQQRRENPENMVPEQPSKPKRLTRFL
jgi:hypothetical protein